VRLAALEQTDVQEVTGRPLASGWGRHERAPSSLWWSSNATGTGPAFAYTAVELGVRLVFPAADPAPP
jgi:hypothetical protein